MSDHGITERLECESPKAWVGYPGRQSKPDRGKDVFTATAQGCAVQGCRHHLGLLVRGAGREFMNAALQVTEGCRFVSMLVK
jgi:hypothetical protein